MRQSIKNFAIPLLALVGFACVALPTNAFSTPLKQGAYTDFETWLSADFSNTPSSTPQYTALAVYDFETLRPLHFFAETRQLPTASLMKLVTAGTVIKNTQLDWDEKIGFSWWDNEGDLRKFVGKKDKFVLLKLEPGEKIPVRDMFASMLIVSANNAANRLATYTSGKVSTFVREMATTASEWGMTATTIDDPSGLSLKNTSNAHDLGLAICQALRHPEIAQYAALPQYDFAISATKEKKILHTVHEIRNHPEQYFGGKTGYLHESLYHVAAGVITPSGRKLCVAVLTSPTRGDSEAVLQKVALWADAMHYWPNE